MDFFAPGIVALEQNILVGTTATTILTYTSKLAGMMLAYLMVDVDTAPTTLMATLNWTNPNTGAQTYTWENGSTLSVESRAELPYPFYVSANKPITIVLTAGTANQVHAGAFLVDPLALFQIMLRYQG